MTIATLRDRLEGVTTRKCILRTLGKDWLFSAPVRQVSV